MDRFVNSARFGYKGFGGGNLLRLRLATKAEARCHGVRLSRIQVWLFCGGLSCISSYCGDFRVLLIPALCLCGLVRLRGSILK